MSIQRLQFERAIAISTANYNIEIPFPGNRMLVGIGTAQAANKLICVGANFITRGVKAGDIVFNTATNPITVATVTTVDSESQLSLSSNLFPIINSFTIYQSASNAGLLSIRPVVFIGGNTAGVSDVCIETEGGESVLFNNVPVGSILPIRAKRVLSSFSGTSTSATNLVALY